MSSNGRGAVDLRAEIAVEQLEFEIEFAEASRDVGPGLGPVVGQALLFAERRDVGCEPGALPGEGVLGLSNGGILGQGEAEVWGGVDRARP